MPKKTLQFALKYIHKMPTIRKILTAAALSLTAMASVSCTQFCARFADMGQVSTGIQITEPKEVYRVENRLFIRGVKAEFEYRHDWIWKELKTNGGEYSRIPGSEIGSLYHEISQNSDSKQQRYYLKSNGEWLTELPGKPSGKFITFSNTMPRGVYKVGGYRNHRACPVCLPARSSGICSSGCTVCAHLYSLEHTHDSLYNNEIRLLLG